MNWFALYIMGKNDNYYYCANRVFMQYIKKRKEKKKETRSYLMEMQIKT